MKMKMAKGYRALQNKKCYLLSDVTHGCSLWQLTNDIYNQ